MELWTDIAAIAAYLAATLRLARQGDDARIQRQALILAATAVALHAWGLAPIGSGGPVSLSVGAALSLFLWQCAAVHVLALARFPLWQLSPAVWSMAISGIVLARLLPPGSVAEVELSLALRVHVVLSLFAWALLTLAALQTASYAIRDRRLHRHRARRGPTVPLQTMENLAFGLMSCGFVLLCLSVLTGFVFIDNFAAQHLLHKVVLSLLACAVFGAVLLGRMIWGWRGRAAIRWAMGGYASLLLAYFGSKLVLEQLLGRSWS